MTTAEVNVEEFIDEDGKPRATIKTNKRNATYTVAKTDDGFAMFQILVSKGSLPKELSGLYTRLDDAIKALTHYIVSTPDSKAASRDKYFKDKKKNDSTVLPESG